MKLPDMFILQGINISHLGKRKIIFKMPFLGDMLIPWRVSVLIFFEIIQYKVFTKNYEVPLYGSNNMWFNYHT